MLVGRLGVRNAGVKFSNVTSGNNIGSQCETCEFTQSLGIFEAFTGTDLNVSSAWVSDTVGGNYFA